MSASALRTRELTVAYGDRAVVRDVSFDLPDAGFTVVVGPNACGKSTLLKALTRTLKPASGEVLLDGRPIGSYRGKAVARRLALLPQSPIAPEGISVRDLAARGRYPHQSLLRQWGTADAAAVARALTLTDTTELADRPVAELSGGQRQRAWLAMVLAQETGLLLLDEPTTFLDIGHQYEVLDLLSDLHVAGRTVLAVLHDLNQAVRYATHLVCMKDGRILAEGPPAEIMTEELVRETFGIHCRILADPDGGGPLVVRTRPAGTGRLANVPN